MSTSETELLPKVYCDLFVQITIKVKQVRNDESLYDKQIRFASSLLRVVPTKYQTNDVYNT